MEDKIKCSIYTEYRIRWFGQYFNIKFFPMLLYIFQMRWKKFNIKIYLWITLHINYYCNFSTGKNIFAFSGYFWSCICNNIIVLIFFHSCGTVALYGSFFIWRTLSKICGITTKKNSSYFSQQNALWERSHVDNSFRYTFIYRFSYLLTYYYSISG
jgi:hypothetical protein